MSSKNLRNVVLGRPGHQLNGEYDFDPFLSIGGNHVARATPEVSHLDAPGCNCHLAVTQRFHVRPMDAQTEWPGTTRVRRV